MAWFKNNKSRCGLTNEIRCDESSYLIWKWHPVGTCQGESKRENAIRWGSSLRVKDGEVAVFVYRQPNGIMQDYIEGPFDQILETANLPILANLIGLAYDGGTPFQAEVYFINLARIIQMKFAVPFFDIYDPRFADFGVPVAVRGTVSFNITNYREFIKLHRLSTFNIDDFQKQIRDVVCRYVKDTVANAPAAHNIPVVQIESKLAQINDVVEFDLAERLKEHFGVNVSGVDIGAIEIDKASDGYRQLMVVTKDLSGATAKAEAEAKIKNIADQQRIESENYEETLRIQREEGQYAQRMHTCTANFEAFQVEKQADVSVAGANALGQMGANGAGNINMSAGDGTGFNMAAMMASMAVGGAVGQNIAGTMNNMMTGVNQQAIPGTVPPPVPAAAYHVVSDGKAIGPFAIPVLAEMVASGQFNADSLVWINGMTQWEKAGVVDDLKSLFANSMPPIPTNE